MKKFFKDSIGLAGEIIGSGNFPQNMYGTPIKACKK